MLLYIQYIIFDLQNNKHVNIGSLDEHVLCIRFVWSEYRNEKTNNMSTPDGLCHRSLRTECSLLRAKVIKNKRKQFFIHYPKQDTLRMKLKCISQPITIVFVVNIKNRKQETCIEAKPRLNFEFKCFRIYIVVENIVAICVRVDQLISLICT